ncbi:uncharacterized mitochondrial protein-like protein [Tanacetum coccineum]
MRMVIQLLVHPFTKLSSDIKKANTVGDAREFALMGVTSEFKSYKNSLKTLEKQKRVLQKNQLTLEDKIRVLSIELENTTNLLKHSERINATAETAKKELQTELDNHLVQIKKWETSSKNLFRLIDSSMSVRTKVGLGFSNYISKNELGWDDSAFSVFTTNSEEVEGRPHFNSDNLQRSTQMTLPLYIKFKSSEPKSNGFYLLCIYSQHKMANKTVGNGVGPVHSRNNVNHQNQFVPQAVLLRTGKVNITPARPQSVPTEERGTIDKTLFLKKYKRDITLVQVYVDDIIFGSTKKARCDEFEALMKGEFELNVMGELTFFLGLQVQQRPDGIFINQDKYVQEILKKFDLECVRTATTPYEAPKPKSKNEPNSPVNVHLYRSMIGSLMYLTTSRPDIMFAVSACLRFQVTPTTSNLKAVKKIFKYLKGQPRLGLWYPRESPFVLEAYSDSDYAGANKDRKSTTGGCQFLGRRLISWQCKKQTIVATSSTEAEYVAAANCCGQASNLYQNKFHTQWRFLFIPFITVTLPQDGYNIGNARKGEGAGVVAPTVPQIIPEPIPEPMPETDQPQDHLTAPPRQQTSDPIALVFEHGQSHTSGGAEDPITLTALSSVVSTLVQKVNSLETELKAHKKLFKDVVGKLVKQVKAMEVKLKIKKRKVVVSDSDKEDGGEQDVDLDALHALANAAVTVDSTKSPGGASSNPAACSYDPTSDVPTSDVPTTDVPTDVPSGVAPTGPSTVSPGSTTVPTSSSIPAAEPIPARSGTTTATPSSPVKDARKGKGVAVEEPTPTQDKTFKQLEEERLGWEAAQRLQAQELADLEKQRAESLMKDANLARQMSQDFEMTEDQRKRQQEVLASAANYSDAAWDIILARLQANPDLSSIIFGVDFTDDDFAAKMVALVNSRRKELAEQRAQERRDRPMTPAQLRQYMRTYLQEEFDKIQRAVAFTRGLKRDGSPMTTAFSKKLKTGDVEVDVEAPSHGVPQEVEVEAPSQDVSREKVDAPSHSQNIPEAQVEVPSQEATVEDVEVPSNIASKAQQTASSLKKVGTKKKLLGRKGVHTSQSTIPIEEGDPDAEHKLCIKYASDEDSASDCDTPVHLYVVVDWELLPTGLGSINAIYRLDNSRKYFTSLREILHLVTRADLMTIYGRVMTFYQDKKAEGVGLVLWGDLKILMDSPEVINSPCYHNKELASPEQTATAEVVPKSVAGSSFPAASSTLLPFDVQICAEVSCVQVKTQADWMLLYVVPTGRVVVPTGRYVVPAGKVIIIVSPSRLNLVPTGRILSPGRVK